MRVQGGSTGLIAAIIHGTIDALDADRDERTEKSTRFTEAEWRALRRRRGFVHHRKA